MTAPIYPSAVVSVPLREDLVLGSSVSCGGCPGHAPAHPLVSPPARPAPAILFNLVLVAACTRAGLCAPPRPARQPHLSVPACSQPPAYLPAPPAAAPRTTCSTQGTMTTRHLMPWGQRSASGRVPSLIMSARRQRSRWARFVLRQSVPGIPADAGVRQTRTARMLRSEQDMPCTFCHIC